MKHYLQQCVRKAVSLKKAFRNAQSQNELPGKTEIGPKLLSRSMDRLDYIQDSAPSSKAQSCG